jgi:hypothetical protein
MVDSVQISQENQDFMSVGNRRHPAVDKVARTLLASTCLTAASGAAVAGVINESTFAQGGDFPGTFPGSLLPVGTTVVDGTLTANDTDFFEFQGLVANTAWSITVHSSYEGAFFDVFNSADTSLASRTINLETGSDVLSGTVPGNGDLVVELANPSTPVIDYQAVITSTLTPEPAPWAGTGLALAGALAWRRKRLKS